MFLKSAFNILSQKILHNGFFKLHEVTFKHKKHDGTWSKPIKREIFGGAQVASILPYDPVTKKIILIDQFRPGILKDNHHPVIKEIVAGIIDKGESPEETAKRECKEEIDCDILSLIKICSYYPAPGSSESYYHLFLGEISSFEGNKIVGQKNENEDILARCYSLEEVKKLLINNKIINALTLIALQWFFLNYNSID